MEENPPSNASKPLSLAEIDFPTGDDPRSHSAHLLDPREMEKHFAPLLKNRPSPEQRWERKSGASAFPGL